MKKVAVNIFPPTIENIIIRSTVALLYWFL
jgi:hypothetical protein